MVSMLFCLVFESRVFTVAPSHSDYVTYNENAATITLFIHRKHISCVLKAFQIRFETKCYNQKKTASSMIFRRQMYCGSETAF